MGRINDISLVTQVTVFRNRRAFDQLVREYQSPVRRFFLSQTLGNEALSDDLSQDTFLKAYTCIGQYRGTASFLTWLMRIAYNVWYDHCRRNKTEVEVKPEMMKTSHDTLNIDICQALAQLKEEERTCITLQLIDGYSISEIADITRMPENTVKSHLKRGKEKTANYLRENGYDRR
jgi:RNA polymerase sigma-70 factor (ECF subfamily)